MKKSRKAAIAVGDRAYNTGEPCIYGHYSKRITIDGSCYACRMENQKAARKALLELMRKNREGA